MRSKEKSRAVGSTTRERRVKSSPRKLAREAGIWAPEEHVTALLILGVFVDIRRGSEPRGVRAVPQPVQRARQLPADARV